MRRAEQAVEKQRTISVELKDAKELPPTHNDTIEYAAGPDRTAQSTDLTLPSVDSDTQANE
jgi:hypothetical protein